MIGWLVVVSSPFSYTCKRLPKDAENQLEAALGAVSALRKPYGTSFIVRRFLQSLASPVFFCSIFDVTPVDGKFMFHVLSVRSFGCSLLHVVHLAERTGRAHGNIVDWMYKRAGIKYSYAAHLRDTGTVSINPSPDAHSSHFDVFIRW
jgi:extracellular matrix protein 14